MFTYLNCFFNVMNISKVKYALFYICEALMLIPHCVCPFGCKRLSLVFLYRHYSICCTLHAILYWIVSIVMIA